MWDTRPFVFKEVDIMKPGQKGWQDIYEFDVPVVSLTFPPYNYISDGF